MIYSIQYMRAIAALLVVVEHAVFKGTQYSTGALSGWVVGESGVDLFFIISGYIMCHTVDNKPINVPRFLWARVTRIIPLYWVLSTCALMIFLIDPSKVNSSGGTTSVLHSYFLLPTDQRYLIHSGWTLSYEFYFYAIFALFLPLSSRFKLLMPVVLMSVLVAIGVSQGRDHYLETFFFSPMLLEFGMGILVFYALRGLRLSLSLALGLIVLSLLLLVAVNLNLTLQGQEGYVYSRVLEYGVPMLLLFIGVLGLEDRLRALHQRGLFPALKVGGDISYALYLSHPFSLVLSAMVLSKLGLSDSGGLFVFLLVMASLVGGYLCYQLIEMPLARMIKRRHEKKRDQQALQETRAEGVGNTL